MHRERNILSLFDEALSSEQKAPLFRTTKNASILAGAGSGKTRTLVHLLLADLIKGIPAGNIIAFTFTEKAAEELIARIYSLAMQYCPEINLGGLYIGTIHGWCLHYLSRQQDFYNYSPLDELQVHSLVSRLYDFLKIESIYRQRYPIGIDNFNKDLEVFYNENLKNLMQTQFHCPVKLSIFRFLQLTNK